ncbi:MAG TPA: hypothetical protein VFH85_07935 [Gammaproteobacteria bacterium]|nr:hypothetical protein [Gammaproteobacteria bacterium]
MADYHAIPARIIVKPRGEPIFSEMATVVEVTDEAAGPFVAVSQPGGSIGTHAISIDGCEWPLIRQAIDDMLAVSQGLGADTLPDNTAEGRDG